MHSYVAQSSAPSLRVFRRSWWANSCLALIVLLAALEAYISRAVLDPDSVVWLDMAQQIRDGNLQPLGNPYWNSLFPVIIAGTERLWPALANETVLLRLAGLLIFMGAAYAFWFFYRTFYGRMLDALPEFHFYTATGLAFCLFWYCGTQLISSHSGPDLLAAMLVCLDAAWMYRVLVTQGGRIAPAIMLGICLGVGYYARSVLLPGGIVLLLIGLIAAFRSPARRTALLASGLIFAGICAPGVFAISSHVHHFSTGEAGKLNYAWWANGVKEHTGWLGNPDEGYPLHGPRVVDARTMTLEFSDSVEGSFPLWYDPVYWYEGLRVRFLPMYQIKRLSKSIFRYTEVVSSMAPFFGCLIALCVVGWISRKTGSQPLDVPGTGDVDRIRAMIAILWPLVMMGMYAAVSDLQARYVAPFLVLCLGEMLWILRWRTPPIAWSAIALATIFSALIGPLRSNVKGLLMTFSDADRDAIQELSPRSVLSASAVEDGRELNGMGVEPHSRIAVVGNGIWFLAARPAHVRIVADVFNAEAFWAMPETARLTLLERLRPFGVKAIVVMSKPEDVMLPGWARLSGGEYVKLLQ